MEPQVSVLQEPEIEAIVLTIVDKEIPNEFREIAAIWQALAKAAAPRRKSPKRKNDPFGPRSLKASIRRSVRKFDGGVRIQLKTKRPGLWQELGTQHHDAQPFLAPTAEIATRDVSKRIERAFR